MMPIIPPLNETHLALMRRYGVRPSVRLPKEAKPMPPRPPHVPARLRRLAEKDKLTPKETAAWLDDWMIRINSAP